MYCYQQQARLWRVGHAGEDRWILKHVVGQEDGLGVECLSGSGSIAAAYSRAFQEGLTITYVSSRTVGIGAYLARLGRCCPTTATELTEPFLSLHLKHLNRSMYRSLDAQHLSGAKKLCCAGKVGMGSCRRCIQRADQPIILTGYAALNKLLGRDVYSSQLQLGGPKVSPAHHLYTTLLINEMLTHRSRLALRLCELLTCRRLTCKYTSLHAHC